MAQESLQDRYAPASVCFGCGPANERGLRIKSRVEGDLLVCDWDPKPEYHAFDGVLSGGIAGTLLDCHSNWAAANAMMVRDGTDSPPATVTSDFCVKLLRPTPTDQPVHLSARVVELHGEKAVVESTLESGGKTRATFRGTFVAVTEGHPAYGRWSP